ncbi:LytTR family DNA-binding domain-containing protein [Draconibacterium sp.]|nr:LytTR family DNA-binding domain-containing protein [Draconibacterium sp.]
MKVIIIEDEHFAAEKLVQLLLKTESQIEILAILESVEDSINWISSNPPPDLIFMDIQLDDGISFEIFDAVKIEIPIIFTTAFDEYAIRAFKVNSVDYLLKPIEQEALKTALEKFRKLYAENRNFEEKVSKVIEQISKKYKSRFFIKVGNRFQSVQVNEICCFFVEERNTFLKTIKGKTCDLDYSLEQLQKMTDPAQFFRVNRNFLVNINCISEIVSYSTSRLKIKLENNLEDGVIVSRDKVSEFKGWMDR